MSRIVKGRSFYKEPWYSSYRSMMDRCYRKKAANYPRYGGRGITVCDEWQNIDAFGRWAEANGFEPGLTLDRINPNGNYEPSNCRWATRKQQANNRTNTVYVTIDGVTKTLSEWADFVGLSRSTVSNRYYDGVRGVMLLHRADDTKFSKGYNRYGESRHYKDYTTAIIEAENPFFESLKRGLEQALNGEVRETTITDVDMGVSDEKTVGMSEEKLSE